MREEERGEGGEEGGEREGTPLSLSLSPLPPSLLPPPRLQEVQPTFLDLPDGGLELGPSDGGDGCVDRQELAGACGLGPVGVDGGDVEGEESGAAGAGRGGREGGGGGGRRGGWLGRRLGRLATVVGRRRGAREEEKKSYEGFCPQQSLPS